MPTQYYKWYKHLIPYLSFQNINFSNQQKIMQNKNMKITEFYEELYKTTHFNKYLLNLKVL